jgi:uncharacterized beta-barrel protein YwiB (DUF1934 family)
MNIFVSWMEQAARHNNIRYLRYQQRQTRENNQVKLKIDEEQQ